MGRPAAHVEHLDAVGSFLRLFQQTRQVGAEAHFVVTRTQRVFLLMRLALGVGRRHFNGIDENGLQLRPDFVGRLQREADMELAVAVCAYRSLGDLFIHDARISLSIATPREGG